MKYYRQLPFTIFLAAVLGFAASTGTVYGQDDQTQPVEKPTFIQEFDKNGDGFVAQDEFPGPAQVFQSLDRNQDGFIAADEAPQGKKMGPGQGQRMSGQEDMMKKSGTFMEVNDKNLDGFVSKDEFKGPEQAFQALDKNQDGFITADEAPQGQPKMMHGKQDKAKMSGDFMQTFDKDLDGFVSKDEFKGPEQAFQALDKNQDGFIDKDEAPKGGAGKQNM